MLLIWFIQSFASQFVAVAVTFFLALVLPHLLVPSIAESAADVKMLMVVLVFQVFMVTSPLWQTNGHRVHRDNWTIVTFLAFCSVAMHTSNAGTGETQRSRDTKKSN
jgi:hypothetical protein